METMGTCEYILAIVFWTATILLVPAFCFYRVYASSFSDEEWYFGRPDKSYMWQAKVYSFCEAYTYLYVIFFAATLFIIGPCCYEIDRQHPVKEKPYIKCVRCHKKNYDKKYICQKCHNKYYGVANKSK